MPLFLIILAIAFCYGVLDIYWSAILIDCEVCALDLLLLHEVARVNDSKFTEKVGFENGVCIDNDCYNYLYSLMYNASKFNDTEQINW